MTKRIRVEVTAVDIRRGKRLQHCFCPVARAISRALGFSVGEGAVSVGSYTTACERVGFRSFDLPARVTFFIDRFDTRRPVKPFVFTLKLPERGGTNG